MPFSVSKRITPSGTGEDLDLNNQLFVVFARRVSPSLRLDNLDTHAVDGTGVRGSSADQFAIASAVGVGGGNVFDTVHRPNLIRAHGILMIIAWPLLAITAIFFALFMRPALPNGEWFQVRVLSQKDINPIVITEDQYKIIQQSRDILCLKHYNFNSQAHNYCVQL